MFIVFQGDDALAPIIAFGGVGTGLGHLIKKEKIDTNSLYFCDYILKIITCKLDKIKQSSKTTHNN